MKLHELTTGQQFTCVEYHPRKPLTLLFDKSDCLGNIMPGLCASFDESLNLVVIPASATVELVEASRREVLP